MGTDGVLPHEAYGLKGENNYTNEHRRPIERHAEKVQGT